MPRGVYPRSEYQLKNLILHCKKFWFQKGHIVSEQTRKKMSEILKGRQSWIKGKHHTEETKRKISLANGGKKRTEEAKRKIGLIRKGKPSGMLGEKHWNWQGGISDIKFQIRKLYKYRQWRSDIFTRDDFTCQLCGIKGGYLEADHYPKIFSVIMKEYQIKTLEEALKCEELWNINNGRTLCWDCHHIVH